MAVAAGAELDLNRLGRQALEGARKEKAVNVKNVNGGPDKTCTAVSWLNHWIRYSGKPLSPYCSEKWCLGLPEVGAHVQKDNSADTGWYIIPLCTAHSQKADGSLQIADTVTLVPTNVGRKGA